MKKQIISLSLVISVVASFLSGCGASTASVNNETSYGSKGANSSQELTADGVDIKELTIGKGNYFEDTTNTVVTTTEETIDDMAYVIDEVLTVTEDEETSNSFVVNKDNFTTVNVNGTISSVSPTETTVTTTTTNKTSSTTPFNTTVNSTPFNTTVNSTTQSTNPTQPSTNSTTQSTNPTQPSTNSTTQSTNPTRPSSTSTSTSKATTVTSTEEPVVTTAPTPTTKESKSTTTTTVTTKATTQATTTTKATTVATTQATQPVTQVTSPQKESKYGVDYNLYQQAVNHVISTNDDYAEQLFLDIMNSYRSSLGLGAFWITDNYDAWQTYFSNRFLKHIDDYNIVMHSELGSYGVVGQCEIITSQQGSMTVWDAFSNFMESPDHRSAIEDYSSGGGCLITFYKGTNSYCLVNLVAGSAKSVTFFYNQIIDFEAFLSCDIRTGYYQTCAGDAQYKILNTNVDVNEVFCTGMKTFTILNLIHDSASNGKRLDCDWTSEVENAAKIIYPDWDDWMEFTNWNELNSDSDFMTIYNALEYAW